MAQRLQIEREQFSLVRALEDHSKFLADALLGLGAGDLGYLRPLSAELRNLVCTTSGHSGLLWRVGDAFCVSDIHEIFYPGPLNCEHPMFNHLVLLVVPILPSGYEPPARVTRPLHLRAVFEEGEALHVRNLVISPSEVITKIASQLGTAHETNRVMQWLAETFSAERSRVPLIVQSIAQYAVFTLLHAERVLVAASRVGFSRRRPNLPVKDELMARVPRFSEFRFDTGAVAGGGPNSEGTVLVTLVLRSESPSSTDGLEYEMFSMNGLIITSQFFMSRCRIGVYGLGVPRYFYIERPEPGSEWPLVVRWSKTAVSIFAKMEMKGELARIPVLATYA